MSIANNIKTIISDKGYKQYAIADKIGMDRKLFNSLLNGRKTFMVDYLVPICKALDCSPDEIIGYKA